MHSITNFKTIYTRYPIWYFNRLFEQMIICMGNYSVLLGHLKRALRPHIGIWHLLRSFLGEQYYFELILLFSEYYILELIIMYFE